MKDRPLTRPDTSEQKGVATVEEQILSVLKDIREEMLKDAQARLEMMETLQNTNANLEAIWHRLQK